LLTGSRSQAGASHGASAKRKHGAAEAERHRGRQHAWVRIGPRVFANVTWATSHRPAPYGGVDVRRQRGNIGAVQTVVLLGFGFVLTAFGLSVVWGLLGLKPPTFDEYGGPSNLTAHSPTRFPSQDESCPPSPWLALPTC
jgi:hypothetical protein